jgi:hypothetical protein
MPVDQAVRSGLTGLESTITGPHDQQQSLADEPTASKNRYMASDAHNWELRSCGVAAGEYQSEACLYISPDGQQSKPAPKQLPTAQTGVRTRGDLAT